ncbi:MAG: PAS domain-containing sensor histidine kinase [Terriglobales bacterium]
MTPIPPRPAPPMRRDAMEPNPNPESQTATARGPNRPTPPRFPWHYPPSPRLEQRWYRLASLASLVAGLGALASLLAPPLHWGAATTGAWAWLPTAAAVGMLLLAAAMAWAPRAQRLALRLAAVALAWSATALALELAPRGRYGPLEPALALLALVALAAVLPRRARLWAVLLALYALFTGVCSALESLLGGSWPSFGPHTPVLPPAAGLGVAMLAAAWLAARPSLRPVALLHEASSAGRLTRRGLVLLVVFPLLLVWIHRVHTHPLLTWAVSLGLVSAAFLVFLTMFWKAAGTLDALDQNRAKLRESATEISDLYNQAPCGYHSLDAHGRVVKINDTELRWLGYRREDVVGRVLFVDLLTPASRELFLHHFAQVQQTDAVLNVAVELRRLDGSLLPAVVSSSAIQGPDGRFLRSRSSLFDVKQLRQTEAALQMSEARYQAILASAADAIVTLDEAGNIADFNPAAERMFRLSRADAMRQCGADLLHSSGEGLRGHSLEQLTAGGAAMPTRHIEFQAHRSDGSTFPAELTLTRVAGQSPGLYTAFVRDLTERKRAEAELRDSEERLRLLLDSTGEGIYALDLMGNCILCNPAALRLLGYDDAAVLLGRPMHSMIHHTRADGRPYPAHECRSFLAARQGRGIEVDDELFFRKDGSSFPVEYRSYPVERNGRPVGLVVTFTDITTRRSLETQIRQAQKMEAVGRLAAGIAHDFNNLLTVINGYSDMLLEEKLPVRARDKLRGVKTAGERAANLTHQLLAFSRQQVLEVRPLDCNAAVRALEPLLRRTIGENIELSCDLARELPPIQADPSQLDQVLLNLVVNARDAMPDGGRIRIATSLENLAATAVEPHPGLKPGDYVLLAVSDNGAGMPPEIQAHIFEPFFTTKPLGKGTGLGLPTVFGIARQSGGTVVVQSAAGQGTTMRVYLPLSKPAAERDVEVPAAPIASAASAT